MAARARSLREVLKAQAEQIHESIRTSMPGVVVSWAPGPPPVATVRPLTQNPRRVPGKGVVNEQLPDLPNCPVLYPSGGDTSDVWPLQAGDHVYILIPDTSTAEVQAGATTDGPAAPRDPRRHDLSDAQVLPMAGNISAADAVDAVARVIRGDDIRLGAATATAPVALATLVASNFTDIEALLNDLIEWHNACLTAGSYVDPAALLATYAATSTAAAKVKAE